MTVSRREFVAAAATVGASALLGSQVLALDAQGNSGSSSAGLKAADHEVVAAQAVPFPMKNVRLRPGKFSAAAEANRRYLKTLSSRPVAPYFPLDGRFTVVRRTAGRLGKTRLRIARAFRRRTLPFGLRAGFRQFRR